MIDNFNYKTSWKIEASPLNKNHFASSFKDSTYRVCLYTFSLTIYSAFFFLQATKKNKQPAGNLEKTKQLAKQPSSLEKNAEFNMSRLNSDFYSNKVCTIVVVRKRKDTFER